MGKIDIAVRHTLRELEREARKSISSGIVSTWNGYKIVSLEKWMELKKKGASAKTLFQLIPEDYTNQVMFFHHIPRTQSEDSQIAKWESDWEKYCEEKKAPGLGAARCYRCILHPDSSRYQENLHSIVMKGLDAKFPCDVVNIFQCPFKEQKDLFTLNEILDVLDDAISHASRGAYENEHTNFAWPSKSRVESFWKFHHNSGPSSSGSDKYLGDKWFTKIPIGTIPDMFKVLTDKRLLEMLIDEYIAYTKRGERHTSQNEIDLEVEQLKKIKPAILDFFASIKSKIKLEDVRDSRGRGAEQEKIENKNFEDWIEKQAQSDPELQQNRLKKRNGLCMNCNEFANILCMECNRWICPLHYDDHKVKVHKIFPKEN
jgi:hypothetical protein